MIRGPGIKVLSLHSSAIERLSRFEVTRSSRHDKANQALSAGSRCIKKQKFRSCARRRALAYVDIRSTFFYSNSSTPLMTSLASGPSQSRKDLRVASS